MDGESLRSLQLEPTDKRRSRAIGHGMGAYVDVCMVPTDQDLFTPNYTSVRDLSLAIRSEHCEFPPDLKGQVLVGLLPHTSDKKRDTIADKLADHFVDDTEFINLRADHQFTTLLQVHRAIDIIKIQKYGAEKNASRAKSLSYKTTARLMELMPLDPDSIAVYHGVANAIDLMRADDPWYDWLHVKAKLLSVSLTSMGAVTEDMQAMRELMPSSEISDETKQSIDDLFDQALLDRHYGVKLCYTDAMFGGSYIFQDTIEAINRRQNEGQTDSLKTTAQTKAIPMLTVEISDETEFDELVDGSQIDEVSLQNGAALRSSKPNEGTRAVIHLGSDGELYFDVDCESGLRVIYEVNDCEDIYEMLRAEIISNYSDLVTPAEIVEAVGISTPKVQWGEKADAVIGKLILPRKKYANRKEISDDDELSRSIRIHGVTYHKRKLLPHQRASDAAKKLAEDALYDLPEGYTFVRAHTRGNGPGKISGHKISK